MTLSLKNFACVLALPILLRMKNLKPTRRASSIREELVALVEELTRQQTTQFWLSELEQNNVPCGPVQTIEESLDHEHTKARDMVISMSHEMIDKDVRLIANPLKFEKTPVSYRTFPPRRGEHTTEILKEQLGLDDQSIDQLNSRNIIEIAPANKEQK